MFSLSVRGETSSISKAGSMLALAPMQHLTDLPFWRLLARRLGPSNSGSLPKSTFPLGWVARMSTAGWMEQWHGQMAATRLSRTLPLGWRPRLMRRDNCCSPHSEKAPQGTIAAHAARFDLKAPRQRQHQKESGRGVTVGLALGQTRSRNRRKGVSTTAAITHPTTTQPEK